MGNIRPVAAKKKALLKASEEEAEGKQFKIPCQCCVVDVEPACSTSVVGGD
jgi:hypothetical protein